MDRFSSCFLFKKKLFAAFPWVVTSTGPGGFMICVFYDGNSRRLNRKCFMEKPGIERATPGLQDISLSPTPRRLKLLWWWCSSLSPKSVCNRLKGPYIN